MGRTRVAFGSMLIAAGMIYLVVAGFDQASSTHMTVGELVERSATENVEALRIQLGGKVVEGSIEWDRFHHRPTFTVTDGQGVQVPARYTGHSVLPDTFKDGSPVVLEGHYSPEKGYFEADVVFAKCPSKYEGQSYEGHEASTGDKGA